LLRTLDSVEPFVSSAVSGEPVRDADTVNEAGEVSVRTIEKERSVLQWCSEVDAARLSATARGDGPLESSRQRTRLTLQSAAERSSRPVPELERLKVRQWKNESVTESAVRLAIEMRIRAAGISVSEEVIGHCAIYLAVLARWNRRLNLTALAVDPPSVAAIDRLIIEPLIVSAVVRLIDRKAVDVGSGNGSPALPMAISSPRLSYVLVESKTRKSAFLREAIRELGLCATVETARFEDYWPHAALGTIDVVTLRAVRTDVGLLEGVAELLSPDGRLIRFMSEYELESETDPLRVVQLLRNGNGAPLAGIYSRWYLV
jgi:16S rRNA (guanine527-N7)-methyltransferase